MIIVLALILHWYLSLFCQTFFHHRYSAHRQFTMSKGWERFFFVFSWIAMGPSYLSPYVYGILHRMHHAYADTEKDPHSPKYDKSLFSMMWRTKVIYSAIFRNTYPIEERFKKDLPSWFAFEKYAETWPSRLGWGLLYVWFYAAFASSPWLWLLLPVQIFIGPVHGAVINWFAHKYGTINFKVGDTSRNLFPVDFLMLGEGYHNNHHRFPMRPNFGSKWFEIDPVYPVIRVLNAIGVIHLKQKKVA